MTNRLIVIGGVAAGMSAAARARRTDRNLEVVVYEKSPYISFAACGMPYMIAGDVPNHRDLIARTPEQMAAQGVKVNLHHEAVALDPVAHSVTIRDPGNGEFTQTYSKLVIATGASPIRPTVPGSELEGVFALRPLQSGLTIREFIKDRSPHRAIVVGGGYVGVEMAETLRRLGLEVKMLIRSGKVLRTALDDDMRNLVEEELTRQEVEVIQGTPSTMEGRDRVEFVTSGQEHYPCDLVLCGLGVQPNVELAKKAGVALGATGAIATDERMRTNLPDVYAAGDCAEAHHLVTGRPDYIPLGTTANKQGRVAGDQAAGGHATFRGMLGTTVVRCFDLTVATTGLTASKAHESDLQAWETMIRAKDISHYFPGAADIAVKLVVEQGSRRLLGGQIVGQKGVAKRADVLATALYNRMTVDQLRELDLSYAPPFAPVWDPILVAANVAAKHKP
jgi:NADPH-dependent 2,4-dienoyl-CoA reductase/sulfur reductase-like enzyme